MKVQVYRLNRKFCPETPSFPSSNLAVHKELSIGIIFNGKSVTLAPFVLSQYTHVTDR